MTQNELNKIIEKHQHYLAQDCKGWKKMKPFLRDANLRRADLSHVNFSDADLVGADLRDANLRRADLSHADLNGAFLSGADLSGADLSYADLSFAKLSDANLSGVDLSGANLKWADLSGADLSGVIYDSNTAFFALTCPDEGDFIGWKKIKGYGYIIKLRIPADAKRSSATTRECRCSNAEVLEIQNLDGSKADTDSVTNNSYVETTYTIGETVYADSWDEDRWNKCTHGIHFFITRDEAVMY